MSTRPAVSLGFLDNGAFGDWRAGRAFNAEAFARDLALAAAADAQPDFIVAPDVVAGGRSSLDLSLSWLAVVSHVAPAYLAVQDGMTEAEVVAALPGFSGIFVGGTLSWKIATGARWAALARRRGIACHIGRCGTAKRVAWAFRIGATSIDSSLPLWSADKLATFRRALEGKQATLGW